MQIKAEGRTHGKTKINKSSCVCRYPYGMAIGTDNTGYSALDMIAEHSIAFRLGEIWKLVACIQIV
jgi:hypothetical protein